MTRTRTQRPGVEEWSCTQCSRRLLFRWPPAFEKVVVDRGDESVAHTGGMGDIQVTPVTVQLADGVGLPAHERDWLEAQGIDWRPEDTL